MCRQTFDGLVAALSRDCRAHGLAPPPPLVRATAVHAGHQQEGPLRSASSASALWPPPPAPAPGHAVLRKGQRRAAPRLRAENWSSTRISASRPVAPLPPPGPQLARRRTGVQGAKNGWIGSRCQRRARPTTTGPAWSLGTKVEDDDTEAQSPQQRPVVRVLASGPDDRPHLLISASTNFGWSTLLTRASVTMTALRGFLALVEVGVTLRDLGSAAAL